MVGCIFLKILNFIGNNAATIIALCALFFTAYQVYATRRHNKLTFRPHLTTFEHRNKLENKAIQFIITLMNNGLGPALIKKYELFQDSKLLDIKHSKDVEPILKKVLGRNYINQSFTKLGNNYSMPAKEKVNIFEISFSIKDEDEDEINEIEAKLSRFDLVIEYESIYGEKMSYSSKSDRENRGS